ncbi:MAG: hypothetical protein WD316_08585 [Phycisphaeraceae bacterium]
MTDHPTIVLHLRPLPGVDPERALKAALKRLLRNHRLRCVRVEIVRGATPADALDGEAPPAWEKGAPRG